MKKSDIFLIVGAVLLLVIVFFATKTEPDESLKGPFTLSEGEAGTTEITYSEYEDLIDSEEPFIVIIERTGCGYCEQYMPIVEKVATDKNLPIKYIDIANLSDEENSDLSTSNSYLKKNNWGTPTTLLMVGERVIDSISGYVDEDGFIKFLDKNIEME